MLRDTFRTSDGFAIASRCLVILSLLLLIGSRRGLSLLQIIAGPDANHMPVPIPCSASMLLSL